MTHGDTSGISRRDAEAQRGGGKIRNPNIEIRNKFKIRISKFKIRFHGICRGWKPVPRGVMESRRETWARVPMPLVC
jgi:hypothetical protein